MAHRLDRRDFLRQSARPRPPRGWRLSAGRALAADPVPRIQRRRLGRTGLEPPDIGFGSSSLAGDTALVQHALARASPTSTRPRATSPAPRKRPSGAHSRAAATPCCSRARQSAAAHATRAEMLETLEGSLRRLRTDHIDVYFNHAVNDPARLQNDEWYEFSTRAKQQGKLRFTGMSGHGGRLVECLDLAVEKKLVDVLLVAFNFGQDPAFYERFTGSFDFVARQPELPRVLAKARAAGIGVIAMKTLRGARLNDMRPYEGAGATFAQAAFGSRWCARSRTARRRSAASARARARARARRACSASPSRARSAARRPTRASRSWRSRRSPKPTARPAGR